MLRPSLGALAAPLLVLTLAGCGGGGDDSAADVQARISEQFVDNGLEKGPADCFAEIVVDELGVDEVKDIDFSSDRPPAGLEDELAAAARKALSACDIDLSSPEG